MAVFFCRICFICIRFCKTSFIYASAALVFKKGVDSGEMTCYTAPYVVRISYTVSADVETDNCKTCPVRHGNDERKASVRRGNSPLAGAFPF